MYHCKDCKNRKLGCHSTCEKYLDDKERDEKIKKKHAAERIIKEYEFDKYNNKRNYKSYMKKKRKTF